MNRAVGGSTAFDSIEAQFGREPTLDEIMRANAAVMVNLNDDCTDRWGSAQGYACALTAIMQTAASAIEARSDATGTGAAEGESAVPQADAQEGVSGND